MQILDDILENLIKMDESLEKNDINTTLKYLHDSITKIKENKQEDLNNG